MKPIIIKLIGWLMTFLSDKSVQETMISVAEKLATKTTSKWDDQKVAEFKEFWKQWNENK